MLEEFNSLPPGDTMASKETFYPYTLCDCVQHNSKMVGKHGKELQIRSTTNNNQQMKNLQAFLYSHCQAGKSKKLLENSELGLFS